MQNTQAPAITCAENVALLSLLHSVPSLPSSNQMNGLQISQRRYTLPFDRERSLVGTLAFLANTKDDPDHIPAVCVEEDPDSVSLNVLFAVNKSNWSNSS
jgi:hypothetical protein